MQAHIKIRTHSGLGIWSERSDRFLKMCAVEDVEMARSVYVWTFEFDDSGPEREMSCCSDD